ncbi:MAG: CotH kinase family protein [Desulfocapsa sp.]|nr:CotH kinase family protein [Desulfocapsa sp.]
MRLLAKRNPIRHLYRISFVTAVMLTLPLFMMVGWMIVDAALEYHRFIRVTSWAGSAPSFNVDIMHWYMRDNLLRAYNRATAPEMPVDDRLPLMQMSIAPESLTELNDDLPRSAKEKYHRAYVKYGGNSFTVKARYMGDNYWHWLYPQKSWRLKTKKNKLIDNRRKINIKNPRTVVTFNEPLAQDLARDIGLIAPRVFPVKFVQNNIYMGVYLLWDKIDESVIRSFNRMPGSVYEGDAAPVDLATGVSLLWTDEKYWEKTASRNKEQKQNREDIHTLIAGINTPDLKDFYTFVNTYVDKDSYASFICLDSVTGTVHHDYHHNNKFYFDPYTGKFEQISWDIDEWRPHEKYLDGVENPLLARWKLIPEFDLLRHRRLYELIQGGELSLERILTKIEEYDQKVRPALASDVYRDIKRTLVAQSLKTPLFPSGFFSMEEYDQSIEQFKEGVKSRFGLLRRYLANSAATHNLSTGEDKQLLRIVSTGDVAVEVTGIVFFGSASAVRLYRDSNRNGTLDKGDVFVGSANGDGEKAYMELHEELFSGYRKISRATPFKMLHGDSRLILSPLLYNYFIEADGGEIDTVGLEAENSVTGKMVSIGHEDFGADIADNTLSLHPWDLPPASEEQARTIGPGIVPVLETMVFPKNVHLTIMPGTTLRLAEGVSIFCYGKVTALGTADRPIRFEGAAKERPWGAFVLQGKGASDSVFSWCSWADGSVASRNLINYSGMVSMHEVDNLVIQNSRIGRNYIGDDALHLAYCQDFSVTDSLFENARSDAFDVDISSGTVAGSRFVGSGNDALDFMTSRVGVHDCYFHQSGDKGISAGEKSTIDVESSVFDDCQIGLEVKDQTVVRYGENIINRSPVAINLYKKNWRYGGGGRIDAEIIYAVDCEETLVMDKHSKAVFTDIKTVVQPVDDWQDTRQYAGSSVPGKVD